MSVLTFKRGIHPPENKLSTMDTPVEKVTTDAGVLLTFPMIQHIGAPCKPIVEVGQSIFKGQKLGDTDIAISAPVHSSVSGIVKEIKPVLTPTGIYSQAVIIENDAKDTEERKLEPIFDYEKCSNDEIISLIREGGVVGLGGAGFPTHFKLSPGKPIDTIIVNASECEPYLTSDYRLMLDNSLQLIRGLQIVLKLFPKAKGIIAIEDNKPKAIEIIKKEIEGKQNLEVFIMQTKYPQGSEKTLIWTCLHREIPSGKLPADIGVLVNNVATVISIERAVIIRKPITRKVITVTGSGALKTGNFKVRLGMSYNYLIERIGGIKPTTTKLVSGGPMMGVALFNLDVPVIKTSSSILCFDVKDAYLPKERNCMRCGKCVQHCPMGLMPLILNKNNINRDYEAFRQNRGMDCIECGTCSYVCPSKRHLAQTIRVARRELMAKGIKN